MLGAMFVLLLVPSLAQAEPLRALGDGEIELTRTIDRQHTIIEAEVGIIALPTAPISAGQRGGDTPFGTIGHGDATLQGGLRALFRWNRYFAFGAGALFSPFPTSDSEYGGLRSLPRTHARSYFLMGGEGRYIPIHHRLFEAWVGVCANGVVIADRFTTTAGDDVPPIIGTKETTVRTEGFAAGISIGGSYLLSDNWVAGLSLRLSRWFLPSSQHCSPIGDCATVTGSPYAVELGFTLGYRLPL
jgi:hypothetical protein